MLMNHISMWVAFSFTCMLSVSAYADLMPAAYRGQPNSFYAEFNRADEISPLELTDQSFGPGGYPPYVADPDGPTGPIQPGGSAQIIDMMQFTQPDGQKYDIFIPNVVDPLPVKLFQIQITYAVPQGQRPGPSMIEILDADPFNFGFVDIAAQQIFTPSGPSDPTVFYEKWVGEIYPNPDWEIFRIQVPGQLDQVVIDTVSVPEPTGTMLIGMGLLATITMLGRRRE